MDLLRELASRIQRLRGPLFVSIVATIVFAWPDQIQEVYLILAREPMKRVLQIGLAALSTAALSFLLWQLTCWLSAPSKAEHAARPKPDDPNGWLDAALKAFIAILPLAGICLGLYGAYTQSYQPSLQEALDVLSSSELSGVVPAGILEASELSAHILPFLAGAGVYCIVVAISLLLLISLPLASPREGVLSGRWAASRSARYAFLAVTLAAVLLFAAQSSESWTNAGIIGLMSSKSLGLMFILCLFFSCLAFHLSALTRLYDERGIPVISILLVFLVVGSGLNWNDNHGLRNLQLVAPVWRELESAKESRNNIIVKEDVSKPPAVPPAGVAFLDWLDAHKARRAAFAARGEPYPVYIVAAEGGGIYAANFAGLFLARLYDRCPALRHHVFAVSGVSGGSIGASVFVAMRQQIQAGLNEPDTDGDKCAFSAVVPADRQLEPKLKQYLGSDFLAPLSSSALFPDFLQRFIPYPPIAQFDRARAFEANLEQTEPLASAKDNLLIKPFRQHWQAKSGSPMLLLNATSVERGSPLVFAPFITMGYEGISKLTSIYDVTIETRDDVRLSTAATVSARFPLITPAASLRMGAGYGERFVDGGYYDNSGSETAYDLIDILTYTLQHPTLFAREGADPADIPGYSHIALKVILLTDYGAQPLQTTEGLSEVLTPLRTMYRVRSMRGQQTVRNALLQKSGTRRISLNHDHFRLPLGWQLSEVSQNVISDHVGEPARCVGGEAFRQLIRKIYAKQEAQTAGEFRKRIFTTLENLTDEELGDIGRKFGPRLPEVNALYERRIAKGTPSDRMLLILNQNNCAVCRLLIEVGVAPNPADPDRPCMLNSQ